MTETLTRYDANRAPQIQTWLATAEPLRLMLVIGHHESSGAPHPAVDSPHLHGSLHVVVENQLASGQPRGVRGALFRLMSAGLTRHEAIHAIADAFLENWADMLDHNKTYDEARYAARLAALDPAGWRGTAP